MTGVVAADSIHSRPIDEVAALCEADCAHGLTEAEATRRLARDGRNELPAAERKSALARMVAQFQNPLVLTLLGAAAIAVLDGYNRPAATWFERFGDATAIFLIVALNAVLGFYQEQKAEAALDALQKMQSPTARVRRDGDVRVIAATELVVGDLLELDAGDAVAADARILQSFDLATEESALTGESVPVAKDARAVVEKTAPIADRTNMVFLGTAAMRGRGRALVVGTGPRTELGRINTLIQRSSQDRKTPLEERLEVFGKRVLWACLALSAFMFAYGMIRGGRTWQDLLLEAVSLAVAAIPEGLPAITTITLALGMQRMAKRGAILRKLGAVETLGAATLICTDKTGTLTKNEMTVRAVYCDGHAYELTGVGYNSEGRILRSDGSAADATEGVLRELMATAALCTNAKLETIEGNRVRVIGDPTEGALLTMAAKAGLPRESFVPTHRVVHELPFDSDRKRMTVVTLDPLGRELAHVKGSADVLLPLCVGRHTSNGIEPMSDAARRDILRVAEEYSRKGLRVLAIAHRELSAGRASGPDAHGLDSLEEELTFLGLVAMLDPPRDGVKGAVAECQRAGVGVVMITGDHPLTATAIASELGFWDEGALVVTGQDLTTMSDEALREKAPHVRVFARVTAEQKLRIVAAYKALGEVVAMTGDGVNDAPALREAHIGVALGQSGTHVAREAADMVIADDNFVTIVDAVREGRAIYRNIKKFIFFLLSANAGLVVAVFVGSLLPRVEPLTPLMILWINLVTNGLPALALGVDPPDARQMREPPRKTTEGLLGRREALGIGFVGLWMGLCALAFFYLPYTALASSAQCRALAFSLLALCPLAHALNCRSPRESLFVAKPFLPKALVICIFLSAAIHSVSILVPTLHPVFRTFPLTQSDVLWLGVLSLSILPAVELMKWIDRRTTWFGTT